MDVIALQPVPNMSQSVAHGYLHVSRSLGSPCSTFGLGSLTLGWQTQKIPSGGRWEGRTHSTGVFLFHYLTIDVVLMLYSSEFLPGYLERNEAYNRPVAQTDEEVLILTLRTVTKQKLLLCQKYHICILSLT